MRRALQPWSAFAPALVVAVSFAASLVRWYFQGSSNIYTALAKRFYVPDPDLQWRVSSQHPIWLGLDICGVLVVLALALAAGGVLIRRRESTQQGRVRLPRAIASILAASSLVIPGAAFVSGWAPVEARETLVPTAAVLVEDGIAGSLEAPAGSYVVVNHAGTAVTARLSAGGEAFDARFGDVAGTWQGAPRDLRQPMRAEISVAAASVDTGVGERSKHAREGYLHADQFPRITVTLDRVAAVRANGPHEIAFRAPGTVTLMGKTHPIEITGTLAKLDAAALARQGLAGDVLLVQADFTLQIQQTALAPKAHDLDGDRIPIHVSLVLRHTGG